MKIRPMGPNLFLAEFSSEKDMMHVMKGGPWMLSKNAILLKIFDPKIEPADVVFDQLYIWARIMRLGFNLMNSERGGPLAGRLGVVEKLDVDENGRAWGSYLRARVVFNPTEPVMRADSGDTWRATFVYGEPRREKRHEFWDLLRRLRDQREGPWICCGDFNEVLTHDEYYGSNDRSDAQMQLFRQCLEDYGLVDLGFTGPKFTWTNKQEAETNVRVRLDRAVVNGAFSNRFDDCRVENIVTTTSDHLEVLINLSSFEIPTERPPVQSGFRFEAAWLRTPDYKELMEQSWAKGASPSVSLQGTWNNLHSVAVSLRQWSRDTFSSVRKQIKKMERQLLYLRTGPFSTASLTETREIERKLCELFEREEIIARQCSRVDWLKEGDRNMSFFHSRASARRRANTIKALLREDGTKCDQLPAIKGMVE
ncbi:hypothetical protein ACQ4PT_050835 [Festuca glaucescens]